MFLMEPQATRFDLCWRMFGTPVRVQPSFWLMSLILGYDATIRKGVGYVLAWVACVFVSVLLHEFGHIWMGQIFGSPGYIVLYSFGGLAIRNNQRETRGQRILVSFAGPLIQLLLVALLWFAWQKLEPSLSPKAKDPAKTIYDMLLVINLLWAILNLFPIWPLDGGKITREVCEGVNAERGTVFSLGLSMVVSGLLAVHEFMASQGRPLLVVPGVTDDSPPLLRDIKHWVESGGTLMAIFFALFCVSSFLALQAENERRRYGDRDEWS